MPLMGELKIGKSKFCSKSFIFVLGKKCGPSNCVLIAYLESAKRFLAKVKPLPAPPRPGTVGRKNLPFSKVSDSTIPNRRNFSLPFWIYSSDVMVKALPPFVQNLGC